MLAQIPDGDTAPADAVWIDLLDPTPAEKAAVEAAIGMTLPTRADIEEIESSSRVYLESGAFHLSTPILTGSDCVKDEPTNIGFILTPRQLVTQRFMPSRGFDALVQGYRRAPQPSAVDAFLRVLEMIVDETADALEHASAELEAISHEAFESERPSRVRHREVSRKLRATLRKLGRMSDGISHLRDTLLGIGRIAAFVHENKASAGFGERGAPLPAEAPARLGAVRGDITSLNDYQAHLSSKVQFLLDATLGFISIQQNDIVKTLTVVSVVGVPPVLIAGIYGMNFRVMPELSWHLGYPFALALIGVSALVPFLWLKWRGWM
ncbi:MAG TPA: CorA family divalent cation transporter [Polyangia bacterium]